MIASAGSLCSCSAAFLPSHIALVSPHACVQVVAPMIYNSNSSDKDNEVMMAGMSDNDEVEKQRRQINAPEGTITIVYNKRDAYFSKEPELIAKRMNRRIAHLPCSAQTQSNCVWCCQMDHSSGQQHNRRKEDDVVLFHL